MTPDWIRNAMTLAFSAHEGQYRKYGDKVPYIQHPLRVAFRVSRVMNGKVTPVAAALLHDVLEDTDTEPQAIKNACGEDVLLLVQELTNPSHLPENKGKPRAERKLIDREHLKQVSFPAKIIKLCDRIDNLTDLAAGPPDFKRLYAKESRLLLTALQNTHRELEEEMLEIIEEIERG